MIFKKIGIRLLWFDRKFCKIWPFGLLENLVWHVRTTICFIEITLRWNYDSLKKFAAMFHWKILFIEKSIFQDTSLKFFIEKHISLNFWQKNMIDWKCIFWSMIYWIFLYKNIWFIEFFIFFLFLTMIAESFMAKPYGNFRKLMGTSWITFWVFILTKSLMNIS